MKRRFSGIISALLLFWCAIRAGTASFGAAVFPQPALRGGAPALRNQVVELEKHGSAHSDFHDLFTTEELHGGGSDPYGDPAGSYFSLQGACTDGEYCYFSFLLKLGSSVTVNARIACAKWEDGAFRLKKLTVFGTEKTIEAPNGEYLRVNAKTDVRTNLFHANDLAYNSAADEVAVQYDGGHGKVCLIPAACLRPGGTDYSGVREQAIPLKIGAIDYSPAAGGYLLGVAGSARHFAYADGEFRLRAYFGYPEAEEEKGCGRQSVCSDGRYLYAVHYIIKWTETADGGRKHDMRHPIKARVEVYDLYSGEYLKTVECRSPEAAYFVEGESLISLNGRLYLFFNYIRSDARRYFCFVDLTAAVAGVRFEPGTVTLDTLDGEMTADVGDVNVDGRICAADARLIFRASQERETLAVPQQNLADVNADGAVTLADCRAVLEYLVKY